ncbi:MAG TPA: alkaline phosphatase family protein [Solirubrobacteraceae bacterium]|nr:alkaline phosphatase family protein [Solirubrobacteraceae bacterium]
MKLPPIKHVWLIALSGESFDAALAQSKSDPYLAKQLVPKGTLLSDYALTASSDLANEIALLSGQSVNLDTERDCPTYAEMNPPTVNTKTGLAESIGCVYPQGVQTLADELTAAGLTWKAYMQGMGSPSPAASAPPEPPASGSPAPTQAAAPGASTPAQTLDAAVTCRHPEAGAADPNGAPAPGDPYVTFRNPFVYFHSLLDNGSCASDDVDLSNLGGDLATPTATPNLSWIAPSACDDGSATPCAPGAAAGIGAADGFLKEVVPKILTTAAYREGGLIAIVPDSPPSSPASAAGKPAGALLLSPFVRAGAKVSESFNDFSLLKSLARLFGVLPLGHANDPGAVSLGATVYSTTKKAAQAVPPPRSHRHPHVGG